MLALVVARKAFPRVQINGGTQHFRVDLLAPGWNRDLGSRVFIAEEKRRLGGVLAPEDQVLLLRRLVQPEEGSREGGGQVGLQAVQPALHLLVVQLPWLALPAKGVELHVVEVDELALKEHVVAANPPLDGAQRRLSFLGRVRHGRISRLVPGHARGRGGGDLVRGGLHGVQKKRAARGRSAETK